VRLSDSGTRLSTRLAKGEFKAFADRRIVPVCHLVDFLT